MRLAHVIQQRAEGPALIAQGLAADQVVGLNAGRALVDCRNAHIAVMLRDTGLFHIAHTAMHLDGQGREQLRCFRAPALDHRCQQLEARVVGGARRLIGVAVSVIKVRTRYQRQGTHGLGGRLDGHQHATHIRMMNDGHRPVTAGDRPLHTIPCIGQGLLVGALGNRYAFQAHPDAGVVHHGKHAGQAMVRCAHEIAEGLVVSHHTGGTAVNPEFVLDRYRPDSVTLTETAVRMNQLLRHRKQRNAARTCRRIRQPRQHQVHDIVRHVVIAPGDVDFLPGDAKRIALRLRRGAHRRQIGTGLWFRQIHGAGPLTRDHLLEHQRLQRIVAVLFNGSRRTLRQQRAQGPRQAGRLPHFLHRQTNQVRQALPAVFGRLRQAAPAVFGELAISEPEFFRHDHAVILHPGALCVAHRVNGCDHTGGEAGRFLEHRFNQVVGRFFVARQLADGLEPGELTQHEQNVLYRGAIVCHSGRSP